eukprot:9029209-Pyramimonas_sp.AAC.2
MDTHHQRRRASGSAGGAPPASRPRLPVLGTTAASARRNYSEYRPHPARNYTSCKKSGCEWRSRKCAAAQQNAPRTSGMHFLRGPRERVRETQPHHTGLVGTASSKKLRHAPPEPAEPPDLPRLPARRERQPGPRERKRDSACCCADSLAA